MTRSNLGVVLALGTTQTIAWASSYYLPAILAAPIARELDVTQTLVFGALSGALVISGILGPRIGHTIDMVGGRGMLAVSNGVLALGLGLLSFATGPLLLFTAWIVIGVGMGMGLYEAAFATLTRIYGMAARRQITGITLIAGFASTVGWPLTAWLEARYGWRATCQCWALIHLLLALPINLTLPRATSPVPVTEEAIAPRSARETSLIMMALAYVFAATAFVSSGISALLPTMLTQFGATPATALLAGALIGPAQVAARLFEAGWLSKYHPLVSARLATLMNPLGVLALLIGGPVVAPLFAVLYGAGNGILTIARGTLPLALFGPEGFGKRVGLLSLPARATGAIAPLAIGLMTEYFGTGALWFCGFASLSAFVVLLLLKTARKSSP
ncbi:MAG: MFS transporter [Bradyrhizobium sp.]|uniref:MFS transporter n=1 Tax=Bradyrhizobium sp. TaxID=376 RepID=UPI0027220DD7|nr:MFS transporter [Bradyrhizobium sp.]MDO8399503.1 MFS transporter [Bradyrhizobium sp.]